MSETLVTTRTARRVTIVVPAYNEEQTIAALISLVFSTLDQTHYRYDMVVVDDGSTDSTATILKDLARRYPVAIVSPTRNLGKDAALLTGLDHARGDAVVLMDADLQHPVSLIEDCLAHWRQGYDCVYAVRAHRRGERPHDVLEAEVIPERAHRVQRMPAV